MDISVFEDIGVSQNEAKVFIALLELGSSKAINLIRKTHLQSSSVYNAINNLIERGLVSYVTKGSIKYYNAADPDCVLDYIDMKRVQFQKILPELKSKQANVQPEGVEYYETFKGIKTTISLLLEGAKPGDVLRYISLQERDTYDFARKHVFSMIKMKRRDEKIRSKGLFHESVRQSTKKSPLSEKRFIDIPLPPNLNIFKDKIVMISWGEVPSAVLINSEFMAKQYTDFFEHIWRKAKK